MKTLWKNTGRLNKRAKKLALQITYGAAIVNMTMTGTVHAGKLHKALELEQHEVVSRLLKAGSDPDLQNLCELSPLQIAVGKNSLFMTDLLIDAGADVNATDPVQLSTALHLAAYLGDVDTLILLIER